MYAEEFCVEKEICVLTRFEFRPEVGMLQVTDNRTMGIYKQVSVCPEVVMVYLNK